MNVWGICGRGIEAVSRGVAAERSVDDAATATISAGASKVGYGDESADKEQVHEDGDEGEEGDAADEAGEDDGKGRVDDGEGAHADNGLPSAVDEEVVEGEAFEEVGKDADDDAGASKLERVEEGGKATKAETSSATHC